MDKFIIKKGDFCELFDNLQRYSKATQKANIELEEMGCAYDPSPFHVAVDAIINFIIGIVTNRYEMEDFKPYADDENSEVDGLVNFCDILSDVIYDFLYDFPHNTDEFKFKTGAELYDFITRDDLINAFLTKEEDKGE